MFLSHIVRKIPCIGIVGFVVLRMVQLIKVTCTRTTVQQLATVCGGS